MKPPSSTVVDRTPEHRPSILRALRHDVRGRRLRRAEQRGGEVVGDERPQVVELLADADQLDRQPSSCAIAIAMPPFAVPSSFVRAMPGDAGPPR